MVIEKAYAKINLALEVMQKVDNYHMVNNLMVPISIYDELELEKDDNIFVVNDKIEVNICIKAAKLFLDKYNIKTGVKIKLDKKIPQAAGLAGGSTDAAAVLKGLNRLYNINASNQELKELAAMLGSDVPFFIDTKIALCTNRGEIINKLDINVPNINVLLIKPELGLSTKEVYQNYKYNGISKLDKINNIIEALKDNDINKLKNNIFNDLAPIALKLNNELNQLCSELSLNHTIYISGSGPTMYIIDPTDDEIDEIKNSIEENVFCQLCHTF